MFKPCIWQLLTHSLLLCWLIQCTLWHNLHKPMSGWAGKNRPAFSRQQNYNLATYILLKWHFVKLAKYISTTLHAAAINTYFWFRNICPWDKRWFENLRIHMPRKKIANWFAQRCRSIWEIEYKCEWANEIYITAACSYISAIVPPNRPIGSTEMASNNHNSTPKQNIGHKQEWLDCVDYHLGYRCHQHLWCQWHCLQLQEQFSIF